MKNDRLNGSYWLSVVGCWKKGLLSSYLPTLALAIALTLLINLPCLAQQRWERTYGGAEYDEGRSVKQTQDGGYIVVGYTNSFGSGNSDVYLIKTNASGDTLWTKTYGGTSYEDGWSVQQTTDGGYIIVGTSNSFGNADQVYLIKTNANGDTLWTKTYGGAGYEEGFFVQQTVDGGYIAAGRSTSFENQNQVYLVKTNATGDTLWTRTYGGTGNEYGWSVEQTLDGGYIVAGYTNSFGAGGNDVYLLKTNASGDILWTRTYGGAGDDWGRYVQQTSDLGYIIAGYTTSFGDSFQVYLVKTNAGGDTLWTRTYGGVHDDYGLSVQQTSDGGYVVTGFTHPFADNSLVFLFKTNAGGDILWTKTFGGVDWDRGNSVQQTTDGGYIIAGETTSFGNLSQVYLIKTDANGNVGVEEKPEGRGQKAVSRIKITPNPFIAFTTAPGYEGEKFALYDVSGRRVGTYRGDRVGEGLRAGVYFLRADGKAGLARIVKVR